MHLVPFESARGAQLTCWLDAVWSNSGTSASGHRLALLGFELMTPERASRWFSVGPSLWRNSKTQFNC